MKKILLVGPCPPPIHGASRIHFLFSTELREKNFGLIFLDTAPFKIKSIVTLDLLLSILSRLVNLLRFLFIIPFVRIVYLTLSGSKAQVFDAFIVMIARLFCKPVFCHHHSYYYINTTCIPMKLLASIGRANTRHIFLGEKMRDLYQHNYGPVANYCVSNLAFMPLLTTASDAHFAKSSSTKIVVSHLSNLSVEKGALLFLDIARLAESANRNWQFHLAGPMSDSFHSLYGQSFDFQPNLKYFGSLNEREKAVFYSDSDFFVFLSKYKNEAQPLVLLEAMCHGVIPIASKVGEIPSIVPFEFLLLDGLNQSLKAFQVIDCISSTQSVVSLRRQLFEYTNTSQQTSLCNKDALFQVLSDNLR